MQHGFNLKEEKIDSLTFDIADDITEAFARETITVRELPCYRVGIASPLLDLLFRISDTDMHRDFLTQKLEQTAPHDLLIASCNEDQQLFYSMDRLRGFIPVVRACRREDSWMDFQQRCKSASLASGFTRDHASKQVAALTELYNNVIEHSENLESGQVLFRGRRNKFEIIVRDRGIGVLKSLRQNPKFSSSVGSYGIALERVLEEGVSRHHKQPGRGFGFRDLLVGLANCSEYIRFSSGDYIRECVRHGRNKLTWQTKQKTFFKGFSCSVVFSPEAV